MTASNDSVNQDAEADRRQRFRIDDTAILEVSSIEAEALDARVADDFFKPSAPFRLMREIRTIDTDNAGLLRTIGDQHSELAAYLEAMNRKIDAVGNAVAEAILSEDQRLQSIDLSEGGIGFSHDVELKREGYYAIKVWFHRALVGISAFIRVVASSRAIDGGYHISAAFHRLPESERQVVARHVMQVQAEQQRARRLAEKAAQEQ
ncbi:MAG: hypothetical protein WBN40_11935 [Pseudomonadales bacterium]